MFVHVFQRHNAAFPRMLSLIVFVDNIFATFPYTYACMYVSTHIHMYTNAVHVCAYVYVRMCTCTYVFAGV